MMERKMFYGASPHVFVNAKELRYNLTYTEKKLWEYLKTKPLGYKFRRQHPLGIYIADFYCHKLKLVVEVDGLIHERKEIKEYDKQRQRMIEEYGIKVIRFTNKEILNHFEKVIDQILLNG